MPRTPRFRFVDLLREDIEPPRSNVAELLRELTEQVADLKRRGA